MATRYEQIIANVQSMVNQGAPSQDIDGYLSVEGLSASQFKKLAAGPTIGGQTKEFFKGIVPGAVGLGETAVTGAAALLPEEMEQGVRKYVGEKTAGVKKAFAPELGYEDTVGRKLGEAFGSTVPFFALGPLGAAGRAVGAGVGVAAGAGEARQAAEAAGVTGEERGTATLLGAPTGLLDILAPQIKGFKSVLTTAAARGGVEGLTEAAQKVAQNLIAKGVYNPEQPIVVGAGEEGAYGAGVGALASLIVDMTLGRRTRGAGVTQPTTGAQAPGAPIPATAQQEMFGTENAGFRLPPESYRAAEEKEAGQQNRLFQTTEMRGQFDVLEREMGRLKQQYETPDISPEQKQAILARADELNVARTDLESQIKKLSKGVEGAERAGAAPEPEQRGLDFGMPEMPRQKTGEGVVLGGKEAQAPGLTPEQADMFREERVKSIQERLNAGQMVTPADTAFLRMTKAEQQAEIAARPTPELYKPEIAAQPTSELYVPEAQPEFQLGQQYVQPAPAVAPTVKARPITEADFKAMGVASTNKKLRAAILGKDLTDPAQRAEVQDTLTDFANNPNRSASIIAKVNNFLSSPTFMDQGAFDFNPPTEPSVKKAEETTDVVESTEPIAATSEPSVPVVEQQGITPTAGIEAPVAGGMGVAPAVTGGAAVGTETQPVTLEEAPATPAPAPAPTAQDGLFDVKDATKQLMDATGLPFSVARNLIDTNKNNFDLIDQPTLDSLIAQTKKPAKKAAKAVEPALTYTPEERKTAESIASKFNGKIVWQNKGLSLVQGFSGATGQPVYMPTKGNQYVSKDIETTLPTGFLTPDEQATLTKAKKEIENEGKKRHARTPFPSFDKGNVTVSAGVPKEIAGIIEGWVNLLGMKTNIYITTIDDARVDQDKYTGEFRAIGSSLLNPNAVGTARKVSDGNYYITFTGSTSKTSMLETLAHELGHIHEKEVYRNASPELKSSIRNEFDKWLIARKGETARQFVNALRAKTGAKQTILHNETGSAEELSNYWRGFDEWYADQVSRWATTSDKPISIVEKFFSRLGKALRSFFSKVQNSQYLANETFKQYLETVHASPEPIVNLTQDVTGPKAMLRTTVSESFQKWFGNSVVQNANGTPKVMYHGTAQDIEAFRPKQAGAIFVTGDPKFAESFSGLSEDYMIREVLSKMPKEQREDLFRKADKIAEKNGTSGNDELNNLVRQMLPSSANILPVYVSAQKPFDYENSEHITELSKQIPLMGEDRADIMRGSWGAIESKRIQDAIKTAGFDGFYIREGGTKNLAVYEPSQIKSVFNKGTYDPADSRISYKLKATEAENITAEGQKAIELNDRMKGIANEPEQDADKSLVDRITLKAQSAKNIPMQFRQAVVDKAAPVREQLTTKFNNKVTDSLGEIRGDIYEAQAQEAAGVADQLMQRGGIRIGKDGLVEVYDRVDDSGAITLDRVFTTIVSDLGTKLGSSKQALTLAHRAFIAQRANELNKNNAAIRAQADAAEAKGNKVAAKKLRDQIVGVRASQEEIDAGLEAMDSFPELRTAFTVFTKFNNGIIDFLRDTGRITPAQVQEWKENIGYVPWTRVEEESNKLEVSGNLRTGLVHLSKLPQLDKEGSSKEIRNVLDNMVGHTVWAVKSGLKNRAATKTLEQLPSANELKTQDQVDTELKNNKDRVVFTYKNGERTAYLLDNPEDMAAFSSVIDTVGPVLGAFKASSDMLRGFITRMPTFALSQLSQDTMRAMLLSGVRHPFAIPSKVMKNFYRALSGNVPEIEALGITGAYDAMPDHVIQRARERHGISEKNLWHKAWSKLEQFSLAADMAVRAAIYEQTIAETKSPSMPEGDRVLAFHRAKEYINFKRSGNGQAVRILRHVVPFMNAYIQGMDVLYRTIQGKGISTADKKTAILLFATTGAKIAALSTLYAMLMGDDDDYKGMDEYERDKNFLIPGTNLKIPVAPEVGFLFKVIPERMYQYISREGTDRPVDNTTFLRGMRDAAVSAYGGVNLAPQLVKPLVEVMTNHSFFTGNPIVGVGMPRDAVLQFRENTSELAKLAAHVGLSPMKVDYLMRAYLGTTGGVLLSVTDAIADPNRMSKPIGRMPLLSTFINDPSGRGYKSEFYTFREDVDRVVESVNMFKREGRIEELKEYLTEDKMKLYAMKGIVGKVEDYLSVLRRHRNIVANDPDMSGEEKRAKVDEIIATEKNLLMAYNLPKMKVMAGM